MCMQDHTRVCLQPCEVPGCPPAASEVSSSLDSCKCEFSFRRPMLIWLWSAAGVSHSLGRQLCRNGIQELKYANRFTQRGISLPHSNYSEGQWIKEKLGRIRETLVCCYSLWKTNSKHCKNTDFRERGRKVVAVFMHQMVGVSFELLPQLLHYLINVLLCKVCRTQSYRLSGEETGHVSDCFNRPYVSFCVCKTHLNLKVSPSSEAVPGLISKMPLKGYGWPPYANS